MYPNIEIFGNKLPVFSMAFAIGVLLALVALFAGAKKYKLKEGEIDNLCMMIPIIFLGGYFSAMIFDKIAHWGEKPWYYPAGIAFSGGLIGAVVLFLLFYNKVMKKQHRNMALHIELLIPCVIIAHSIGRIGCFFAGCCYGKPTDSFLGVIFPSGSLAAEHYGEGVRILPTQLIEAFFLLTLFFVVYFLIPRYKKAPVYLISYGVFRFIIEFFRGDNRGEVSSILSPSQIWSFAIVFGGIFVIFFYQYLKKKELKAEISGSDFSKTIT